MTPLAARKCKPVPAGTPALSTREIDAMLKEVPGWAFAQGTIHKSWPFADYYETMSFVNAVAWIGHHQDHHPEMTVGYNRCRIAFSTHSIGGISENDFICAAKIEALTA